MRRKRRKVEKLGILFASHTFTVAHVYYRAERKEQLSSNMAARQQKRADNIASRNEKRKDRYKKGKSRPGFEGKR
jgi:hypothetical protein